jgi:hypothetical protein
VTQRKPKRSKELGVTDAEYARLLAAQGGHCALCPNTPKTRRLHVDHDHATGRVRGLLCYVCNRYLPASRDAAWHRRAADYLTRDPVAERRARLIARIPGDKPTAAQAAALAVRRP